MSYTVSDLLLKAVKENGTNVGLVEKEVRLTWADVHDKALDIAKTIKSLGMEKDECVAIYAEQGIGQAISILAIALADGVFTIINPLLKKHQVHHQLADCDAGYLIGNKNRIESIDDIINERDIKKIEIDNQGLLNKPAESIKNIELKAISISSDIACFIYTSGSTGKPKGVIVPHKTLTDGGRVVSNYLKIGRNDVTASILSLGFDYGLNQLMTTLTNASRIVFHDYLLPNKFFELLVDEEITGFAAVPSFWPKLLHDRFVNKKIEFPDLRYITTAGGVHSEQILKKLTSFFDNTEIIIMYGLTESFRSCYLPFSEIFKRPGSIGKAVPGVEILVRDEEGNDCPEGVKGELYHRGLFINYGYLNQPELTESKYISIKNKLNGGLPEIIVKSGDLVSRDDEGYIYFHGRIDKMIKSMGFRVSPGEVEEVAQSLKGISEAAVASMDDEEFGQIILLFYTTVDAKEVAEIELKNHFSKYLPHYAVPRKFIYLENLLYTSNGKVNYTALIELLEKE